MVGIDAAVVLQGLLLPSSLVNTTAFGVLAAFVAINTMMYTALAIAKMLPKLYVGDYNPRRRRRAETRSIDPDGPVN